MSRPQKKKIKIQLKNTKENEEAEFKNKNLDTFRVLSQIPVPTIAKLRSEYFHKSMILVEGYLNGKRRDATMERLETISNIWKEYSMWERSVMNEYRDHQTILFALRARIDLIIAKNRDPKLYDIYSKEKLDSHSPELQDFIASNTPIQQYSLQAFWRTLKMIMDRFYMLRYSPVIERHIYRLYLCFAKFLTITNKNADLFNYPFFVNKNVKTNNLQVNIHFLESCEFIFHEVEVKLAIYKEMIRCTSLHRFPNYYGGMKDGPEWNHTYSLEKRIILLGWLFKNVSGPFLEPTEQEVQKLTFQNHVNPGEVETFQQQDKHSEASPNNIIARFRPGHYDEIVNMFEKDEPLAFLIKKYLEEEHKKQKKIISREQKQQQQQQKKPKNIYEMDDDDEDNMEDDKQLKIDMESWKSNVDVIAMVVPMITYAMERQFQCEKRFGEAVMLSEKRLKSLYPVIEILVKKQTFGDEPKLIQCMNEFSILYLGGYYRFNDFLSCIIHWVRICCEDRKLMGNPYEEVNLIPLYLLLFPEEKEMCQYLDKYQNKNKKEIHDELGMPDEYFDFSTLDINDKKNNNVETTSELFQKKASILL